MPRAFLALKGRYERPREDRKETQEDHNIEKGIQQTVYKSHSSAVANGTVTKAPRIWRPIKMEESDEESYKEIEEPNKVMEPNKNWKSQETLWKRGSEAVFEDNGMLGYNPRQSLFSKAAKSHVSRASKDWELIPRPPGWCFCNHYDYDAQERYLMKQDASLLQADGFSAELGHIASKRYWLKLMEGSKRPENGEIRIDNRNTGSRRRDCGSSRQICNNDWSLGSNMDSMRRSIDSISCNTDSLSCNVNSMNRKTNSMSRNIGAICYNMNLTPCDNISSDTDMDSMQGSNDAIHRTMDSIPRTIVSIHHRIDSISHDEDSMPQSMDYSMDSILRNVDSMPPKVDLISRNYNAIDAASDTLFDEGRFEFSKESCSKARGNAQRRNIRTGKLLERKGSNEGTQGKERVENALLTSERLKKDGESFSDESQSTDPSERPYVCNICNKSFKRRSSLATHKFIHTDLKPHICTICEKKFLRKSDLKKHSLMHSGKKPYRCEKCGRQFSQSSNMLTHMRRHMGIRPFVCTKCDRSFFRKVDLRRHEGRHLAKKVKRKPNTT